MIPAKVLARFAQQVERDIGITVSVGLSCNKFLAKIASDMDKPRGFATLDQTRPAPCLAEKPVGFIFGVGPATQERLSQRGFRTIADLQRADETDLMKQFSTEGRRLWRLARGIDDRRVVSDRGAKTISARPRLRPTSAILPPSRRCCATVGKGIVAPEDRRSLRPDITLKLKTADFRQRTRSQSIHAPTQLAAENFLHFPRDAGQGDRWHRVPADGQGVSALRPGSLARRHRHARPPLGACRTRDRRSSQEIRPSR